MFLKEKVDSQFFKKKKKKKDNFILQHKYTFVNEYRNNTYTFSSVYYIVFIENRL